MGMKICIELTQAQTRLLKRPIEGSGGWQSLLRLLQRRLEGQDLSLTPGEIARILRYKTRYGQGGFQDRLAGVIDRAENLAREIIEALELNTPQDISDFMVGQKRAKAQSSSKNAAHQKRAN